MRKTYVFLPITVVLGALLFMELVVRVLLGFSTVGPRALVHGFVDAGGRPILEGDVPPIHEAEAVGHRLRLGEVEASAWTADVPLAGYATFVPGKPRVDVDPVTGERFAVAINSRGFRGEEPAANKTPGTVRVVALGASPTFGAYSRDDETWPGALEAVLEARCEVGHDYEVVNLGVPGLASGEVRALFAAEGLPLEPDVVAFYGGAADSLRIASSPTRAQRLVARLRDYSLLVAFVDSTSDLRERAFSPKAHGVRSRRLVGDFLTNVAAIEGECSQRDVAFVAITQQASSATVPPDEAKGLTYAEERQRVEQAIADGREVLLPSEVSFLVHAAMMDALRDWTERGGVSRVDAIEALDGDRLELLGGADLSPRGNRLLAEAIAEEVLALTCSAPVDAAGIGE